MGRRTTLAVFTFLGGLITLVTALFLLSGPTAPAQAGHSMLDAAPGDDCGGQTDTCGQGSDKMVVLVQDPAPEPPDPPRLYASVNSTGVEPITCTQLFQAGGFEGNPERVFEHWHAGGTGAFQRTGYLQYEGAFSMRLHASLGSFPSCAALDPWVYQTVRIPNDGLTLTRRITVEGYRAVGGSLAPCSVYNSTDADDVLYVHMRDGEGTPISDPITITRGGVVSETWEHFSVDFTADIDLESLAGQDVQVYFYATHDQDEYGTWFYLDNLACNVCAYPPRQIYLPVLVRNW